MAIDILQGFLDARLFDVAADDDRVRKLRETAGDVAALLKSFPERVASFTMVAIDGAVGRDEPIVTEVAGLLGNRWRSYAGAFSDAKLPTVARAIVLEALANLVGSDPIAASMAATARNMLPRLGELSDQQLWTELVSVADRRLDDRARREWASPDLAGRTDAFALPAVEPVVAPIVDRKWLAKRMAAAAGPSDAQGQALEKANSSWPNTGSQWSYEFSAISSEAIAMATDSVVKGLAERLDPAATLKAMADALASFAAEVSSASVHNLRVLERRSMLLWWKEALYSPIAGVSYRGLQPSLAAALAAADASAQSGPFAPRTAEHFVREAVRAVDPQAMDTPRPLVELCGAIKDDNGAAGAACRSAFAGVHLSAGRTPLASLLGHGEAVDASAFSSRLGLDGSLELSPIDLATWLFRDLQAAAATPPQPQVKRRKGARA